MGGATRFGFQMTSKYDEQRWFRETLALQGREVEVALVSGGTALRGTITNVMFDSFLLENLGKRAVVRFEDINYLLPLARAQASQ
jgi:hypothetical protein